jgi:uncharacterized delta-60 repeat protein
MKILKNLILVSLFMPTMLLAQSVKIDSTFGINGRFTFGDRNGKEIFSGMARQADGKIVLVGETDNDPDEGGNKRGVVIRLKANGTYDSTFGTNGVRYIDSPNDSDAAGAIKIQSDGKILIAGYTEPMNNNFYVWSTIIRLNSNGSYDSSFGINGVCLVTNTVGSLLHDIQIDTDGKIVASGFAAPQGAGKRPFVCRVNTNGRLDTSFASVGFLVINNFGDFEEAGLSLAIQADKKIVFLNNSGLGISRTGAAVIRLNSNGSLDSSFGGNGDGRAIRTTDIGFYPLDFPRKIAIDNQNNILFSGAVAENTFNPERSAFSIRRLLPNGNFDISFGDNGIAIYNPNSGGIRDEAFGMAVTANNEIFLTGLTANTQLAVLKYKENGMLDGQFASGGMWKHTAGVLIAGANILLDGRCMYVSGVYAEAINGAEGFAMRLCEAPSVCTADINRGLVAHYLFTGNARDSSGNNNNGTVNGAVLTTDRFGRANSAYRFDGLDDNIVVQDHTTLRPSIITISLWTKQSEIRSKWQTLVSKIQPNQVFNSNYLIATKQSSPIHAAFKYNNECSNSDDVHRVDGFNFSWTLNEWQHICATYDGQTLNFYRNGVLTSSHQIVGVLNQCLGSTLNFGGTFYNTANQHFKGELDDIRIYNRAFTECEVKDLYDKEKAPTTNIPGRLVACYNLNNNVNDAINQLNGQLVNVQAAIGRNGVTNTALQFRGTGDSYVSLANSALLRPDTLSVSLWANVDNASTTQYLYFQRNNSISNFEAFSFTIFLGKFRLSHFPNTVPIDALNTIQTGRWYHLAGITRGDSIFFYIDGVLQGAAKSNGPTDYMADQAPVLGGTNTTHVRPYIGRLDNLRIYSRAITAAEVRQLFQQDPNCDGTTATKDLLVSHFNISPNPVSQQIIIQLADTEGSLKTLKIADLTGKILSIHNTDKRRLMLRTCHLVYIC